MIRGLPLPGLHQPWQWLIPASAVAAAAVLLTSLAEWALDAGPDWYIYREASLYLIRGQSPYQQAAFANPPWALIPALPIAMIFSEESGAAVWLVLSLAAFAFTAHRMGARLPAFGIFLIAPTTVHCLLNGNIDWMPLLGFVLPPQVGLLFVLTKPQFGIGLAIYWTVEAYRKGRIRSVIELIYPSAIAFGLSYAAYGLWQGSYVVVMRNSAEWNASFWPYSIPVGLLLLGIGLRRRQARLAYGAGPCLSPYLIFHGWNAMLISFLGKPRLLGAIVLALWIVVFARV